LQRWEARRLSSAGAGGLARPSITTDAASDRRRLSDEGGRSAAVNKKRLAGAHHRTGQESCGGPAAKRYGRQFSRAERALSNRNREDYNPALFQLYPETNDPAETAAPAAAAAPPGCEPMDDRHDDAPRRQEKLW
jgi:hypothetical protein